MKTLQLDNGLTVIARHVPNRVVALDIWIGAGSAFEDDATNGVSHFLEHMLFKGTPRFAPGELDKTIMSVGGVWNAGTSKDFTHYYVNVAAPFFGRAVECLSDMIMHASIDAAEFDREKLVILEEYRRKQDHPEGLLYDELNEVTFPSGPYRRSVIGTFESVTGLTRDVMYDYYRAYYTGPNMTLLAVGDLDEEEMASQAAAAFAEVPRAAPPAARIEPTAYAAGQQRRLTKEVNETYMGLSFPAPPFADPQRVLALDLASTILNDGRSSRLHRILKEEQRLVHSVSGGYPTHRHESLYYLEATVGETPPERVRDAATAVCREFAAEGPTPAELAKARRIIRNQFQFGTETNTGYSGLVGYYRTVTGSDEFFANYLERLNAVTAEDVAAVARECFEAEPNLVVVAPANGKAPA